MGVKLGHSHRFRELESWAYREEVTGDWVVGGSTVMSFVVWTVRRLLIGVVR